MVESHKRGAKGTFVPRAVESARECTNARSKQNRLLDKVEEETTEINRDVLTKAEIKKYEKELKRKRKEQAKEFLK